MSAARPDCLICLYPSIKEVDRLLAQGTSRPAVARTMNGRRAMSISHGRYKAVDVPSITTSNLRDHQLICLRVGEQEPDPYIAAPEIPGVGKAPPISVSAAELADPAKRLDLLREALAQKIGDLSAKELYSMYMAELKLQTAQTEKGERGAQRDRGDDDSSFDDAVAAAAGHRPDLRVVRR